MDYSEVKGIIFDYGGTLDSGGDHWSEVIWKAWQHAGVPVDYTHFREAYVFAERELARTRHILPHHTFADLMLIKMRLELEYALRRGLLPQETTGSRIEAWAVESARYCDASARAHVEEAKRVLNVLSRHYPMVLVSNFYGNVNAVLKSYGIDRYFQQVVESAVVGIRKPDPAIFSLGVEALGMIPEEVLVVGDSLRKDILPAESIGCPVMWIKGKGWTPEEDAAQHPSRIASLDDIPRLLGL